MGVAVRQEKFSILITGPTGAGKTSFISTATGGRVGSLPERWLSEVIWYTMPMGKINIGGDLSLFMLEHPNQAKLTSHLYESVHQNVAPLLGMICLVDSLRVDTFRDSMTIIERIRAYTYFPVVVGVTKQDYFGAWDIDDLRIALRIEPDIPMMAVNTEHPNSVRRLLVRLLRMCL